MSDERLSAYVTNTDRDVFALRNLPEEVVAERTETDLLILAARVALDALSESDRHAVLSRYRYPKSQP